jgi:NAD(P)H dehydrogenase (quinone)
VDCAVAVLTGEGHAGKAYDLTGPRTWSFREIAALLAEMTGRPVAYQAVSDEALLEMFDALGVPRRPVDDQVVADIPWCSEDMVSFERAIREGWFDICTGDVQALTGRPPRTLESVLEAHRGLLETA